MRKRAKTQKEKYYIVVSRGGTEVGKYGPYKDTITALWYAEKIAASLRAEEEARVNGFSIAGKKVNEK